MTPPRAEPTGTPRRVLATRNARWAVTLARWLAGLGVQPNSVSIAGIGWALVAGLAFALVPLASGGGRVALFLAAGASIQLRLLCNLLDGMLAVEGGLKSKTGDIYNDLPDRLADVIILVGAGYSQEPMTYAATLGWAAAVLGVFTAYLRVLGGSLGLRQHFIGPMAKQHRMFTLTVATLVAAIEVLFDLAPRAIRLGLILIIVGSAVTAIRRTRRMLGEIEDR